MNSFDENPSEPGFSLTTRLLHHDRRRGAADGAMHHPVHPSVQYGHERVEDLIAVFQGSKKGAFNYARQGTPTTAALESKLNQMEGGVGAVCFATGMAAISALLTTLLRAGDHIVVSQYVFGNTNSLLGTLEGFGVAVSRVDATRAAAVAEALRPDTRLVFVETVANPGTQIADLPAIGALCRERGVLLVVDNTVMSPALFKPATVGAGLVVHSLTKTIGGHGNALGGVVIDTGLYDWAHYPHIHDAYRTGDPQQWGLTQIRKKGLRDMGASLSSQHAHLLAAGAETLQLRIHHASQSALALAQYLEQHPAVARVVYPGLPSHPQHATAARLFRAGSWLMSVELKPGIDALAVCDRLQLPINATGLADNRTLIIPVAYTIFWEAGAQARAQMGIGDGMLRISVGLEDSSELIADFAQALAA